MSKMTAVAAIGAALGCLWIATPGQAQNARSFVSGQGSDANPCTLAAPCRTFQRAHDATNPSGEIDVLNPAGYGAVTISKAISIINDGVGTASILVPAGGIGILIGAGPGDAVNLRGLTVEGGGAGQDGIVFAAGGSLTVANCAIHNLVDRGVAFVPSASSSLSLSDTVISQNGASGIVVAPTGTATVNAVFDHAEVSNNPSSGITVNNARTGATIQAIARDSKALNNGNGFYVLSDGNAPPATLAVIGSVAVGNAIALFADSFGSILVSGSTVLGNTKGVAAANFGQVASPTPGNNTILKNGGGNGATASYTLQ